jgi:hypothetical protein
MKQLLIILTIHTLLSCGNKKQDDSSGTTVKSRHETVRFETIDDFGRQIFELIRHDSYNNILDLMPDLSEYTAFIDSSSMPEKTKKDRIEELEEDLKENIESLKQTYSRLKEQTERSGIDWEKTNLDHIDYKHTKKDNIESADIYLNFSFKGVRYEIELKDCVKIGKTWLIGNEINWKSPESNRYY